MKKNILSMAALLIASAAVFTACSSDDNITGEQPANPTGKYTMTVQASKDGDATTRALTLDGNTLNATWATTENVYVMKGSDWATGSLKPQADGATATLKGELSDVTIAAGNVLTLQFPKSGTPVYTGQVGTLADIAANYDYATATVTVNNVDGSGNITVNEPATFTNQQAIVKFTLVDKADGTTTLSPTALIINDGTSDIVTLTSIPAETYTTNGEGVLYVALPAVSNKPITLTATVGTDTYTLTTSSAKSFANGSYYRVTAKMAKQAAVPTGALSGEFSVSDTKTVYFSKGNLRYASGTWSFFDNQYDCYTSYSAAAWDKFGWSTSATTYGMNISASSSTYSGDFVDWGATMGSGWYTLSKDEWLYLFGMEENDTDKSGHARYRKYFRATVNNVKGVVVLPDDLSGISDIPAESSRGTASTFSGKTYTTDAWSAMESAGCVFLPAAGFRNGNSVSYVGSSGFYWLSTANGSGKAYTVGFDSDHVFPANNFDRNLGFSVRLVREVPEVAGSYFTANSSGLKVAFSQGNLQATTTDGGTNWTWAFAEHQWDYVGNATATANTSINGNGTVSANGTVEFFCWSTASTYYGIHNSMDGNTYSGDFKDWGTLSISNGGVYTWRTLTSAEWKHIFNDRTSGATVNGTTDARYAHATINTDGTAVNGMILFPDGCKIKAGSATWGTINGNSAWGTKCTKAQWSHLESLGCVFLPAAGTRHGSEANNVGTMGVYWSATPSPTYGTHAYLVYFYSDGLDSTLDYWRDHGRSVRLVREVPSN